MEERAAPTCCGHCLDCLPVALTYKLCDDTRRAQTHEPYQPWWPASIDSPSLYFQLKRRVLQHAIREQARRGHSDSATWRAPHTSAAAGAANAQLVCRGRRQLALRLPAGRTNVGAGDWLEYTGSVSGLGALAPADAQPVQHEAARTQAVHADAAPPAQPMQQQPRKAARPRAARASPLLPALAPLPPPLPAATQMGLLEHLHYHEQCHRQQLVGGPCWGALGEPHPAAYLRPQWQADAEAALQQAAALQQLQQQQAAAAAAASAAAAAAWPYALHQPAGGWAFGGSLVPPPLFAAPAAMSVC